MYMGRFMEIGESNRWLMDISCSEILVIVLYSGSALLGIILIGSSQRAKQSIEGICSNLWFRAIHDMDFGVGQSIAALSYNLFSLCLRSIHGAYSSLQ
uniref:Uncharacterized protein n=1 Tax=Helianthus annuus TaxID=4232 RepID=A0A251TE25_HELAN